MPTLQLARNISLTLTLNFSRPSALTPALTQVREALLEGKNLLGLTALHMAACLGYEVQLYP